MILRVALACTPPPAVPELPALDSGLEELARARIVATGDIMMHGGVKAAAEGADEGIDGISTNHDGYDALYAEVAPDLRAADVAFANLEFPVAPPRGRAHTREMVFAAPTVVLDSLADAGFDAVSFANNHVYDQGRAGFVETLDQLDRVGIAAVGAGRTCAEAEGPRWFELDGIRVAFLAYTVQFNDYRNGARSTPCSAFFVEDRARSAVAQAREDGAELVVLSLHWGTEYATTPSPRQQALAHRLVAAGVDVLVAAHPHVLQPVEVVRADDGRIGVVAYSLGNFVSNQESDYRLGVDPDAEGNPRDGALLGISVVRRRYTTDEGPIERVELADLDVTPLWTRNDRFRVPAIAVTTPEVEADTLAANGRLDEAEALLRRGDAVRALLDGRSPGP